MIAIQIAKQPIKVLYEKLSSFRPTFEAISENIIDPIKATTISIIANQSPLYNIAPTATNPMINTGVNPGIET